MTEHKSYSCIFCRAAIQDESAAITLSAEWMPSWTSQTSPPASQQFWAHSRCLEKAWTGTLPWEQHVLYGNRPPN